MRARARTEIGSRLAAGAVLVAIVAHGVRLGIEAARGDRSG